MPSASSSSGASPASSLDNFAERINQLPAKQLQILHDLFERDINDAMSGCRSVGPKLTKPIEALIKKNLVEVHEIELRDRLGSYRVPVVNFTMIGHISYCSWCSVYGPHLKEPLDEEESSL